MTRGETNVQQLHNIFSLRRSGHHAVISWLEECYRATGITTVHINESEKIGHIPDPDDPQWQVFSADEIVTRAREEEELCNTLIVNYEDLSYIDSAKIASYNDPYWRNHGISTRDTIVVRDWYNLVASRIRKSANDRRNGEYPLLDTISWDDLAALWIEHNRLHSKTGDDGLTWINFNHWRKDSGYRAQLATSFGLKNSPKIDAVSSFGGGSSFDGTTHDGNAQEMQLDTRWEQLDDELYAQYLAVLAMDQSEVIDTLNKDLFGFGRQEAVKY